MKTKIISAVIIFIVILSPIYLVNVGFNEHKKYLDLGFTTYDTQYGLLGGPYEKEVDDVNISITTLSYIRNRKFSASSNYTTNSGENIQVYISDNGNNSIIFNDKGAMLCPIDTETIKLDKTSPTYIFTCDEYESLISENEADIKKVVDIIEGEIKRVYE